MSTTKRNTINYKTFDPLSVKTDMIEAIEYEFKGQRDIEITINQPEFTSVCPMTGLPDFGNITIKYIPNNKIIELKTFKFYLLQYRNVGIFYEHVVNHILNDLVKVISPKQMEITGNFTARGGITTSVQAKY